MNVNIIKEEELMDITITEMEEITLDTLHELSQGHEKEMENEQQPSC